MDDLFGSRARVRLLRLLSRDPKRVWTEREAAQALGMSPNSINLAAKDLRGQGILDFHRLGRSHAIRLREDLRLSQSLETLFLQEAQLWQDMKKAIHSVVPAGAACHLFGSTARGTASTASDMDVLVVGESKAIADEVAAKVRAAATGVMPVSLEVLSMDRRTARRRRRSPLFQNILREGRTLSTTKLEELL